MSSQANLQALPSELISMITSNLDLASLYNLRLTSRSLEHRTFSIFSETCFSSRCIQITTDSLQSLVDISKDRRFASHLQDLYISMHRCCYGSKDMCGCCEHYNTCPAGQGEEHHRLQLGWIMDQQALTTGKTLENTLAEAFAGLPSLKALRLIQHPGKLPEALKCHGQFKGYCVCGHKACMSEKEPSKWYTAIMQSAINAAGRAGCSITTFSNDDGETCAINISTLMTMMATSTSPVTQAVQHVEYLALNVQIPRQGRNEISPGQQLLDLAPQAILQNLTQLSISWIWSFKWEYPQAIWRTLILKINLANLLVLRLKELILPGETYALTLGKCIKLRFLELNDSELERDGWMSVYRRLRTSTNLAHLHLSDGSGKSVPAPRLVNDDFADHNDLEIEANDETTILRIQHLPALASIHCGLDCWKGKSDISAFLRGDRAVYASR